MKPLKIFIYSALVTLVFMACATTKHELLKTTNKQSDTITVKRDSAHIQTINQSINDMVFIPIETGDPKIDSVISKRFANFKTYKKSGDNSYKIAYNKQAKGFDFTSKIGRTKNTLVKKNDSVNKSSNKEAISNKKRIIIKYRIPSWVLLAYLVSLVVVYILSKFRII